MDGDEHDVYAVTDAAGYFQFPWLPGDISITLASGGGYYDLSPDTIVISANSDTNNIVLTAYPYSTSINGQVQSEDGVPLGHVSVSIEDSDGVWYAETDADGKYFIDGLRQGSYRISVGPFGYYRSAVIDSIVIDNQIESQQLDFVLQQGAVIGGTVETSAGAAVYVYIIASDSNDNYAFTLTDENGEYLLEGLHDGEWTLQIYSDDSELIYGSSSFSVTVGENIVHDVSLDLPLFLGYAVTTPPLTEAVEASDECEQLKSRGGFYGRALDGLPVMLGVDFLLLDLLNLRIAHEHYGSSNWNTGYGRDGIFNNEPFDLYKHIPYYPGLKFFDEIMKVAEQNLKDTEKWEGPDYDLFGHNCQHYATALRKEYKRIFREQMKKLEERVAECRARENPPEDPDKKQEDGKNRKQPNHAIPTKLLEPLGMTRPS